MKKCIHCGREFRPNPRVKNHNYCNDRTCQRARRARWQREKMAQDIDYRENQRQYEREWQARHPGYSRNYRARHPEYVKRNRLQQIKRNNSRSKDGSDKMIAKMDSLISALFPRKRQLYKLVPQEGRVLAKMDSLVVNLVPINRLELYDQVSGCLQKRT